MTSRTSALAVLAVAALGAGCATRHAAVRPLTPGEAPRFVRVGVPAGAGTRIVKVPLEDYVLATVLAEFAPPGGDVAAVEPMIEVQAIISRTYALAHLGRHAAEGFDLCTSTHCQVYRPSRGSAPRWAAAAADAVRHTAGTALWFDSAPAQTLFHADCGGHTSAAAAVWGGAAPPYLTPHPDDGPAAAAHRTWEFRAGRAALRQALNADRRTRVGDRFDTIQVFERDEAGRAALVVLQGERQPLVRGEELRAVLVRAFGARSVRSTWFEVTREGDTLIFTGRGFGHGVGLCQAGAFARIKAGASPAEVLSIYFPQTRLIRLGVG